MNTGLNRTEKTTTTNTGLTHTVLSWKSAIRSLFPSFSELFWCVLYFSLCFAFNPCCCCFFNFFFSLSKLFSSQFCYSKNVLLSMLDGPMARCNADAVAIATTYNEHKSTQWKWTTKCKWTAFSPTRNERKLKTHSKNVYHHHGRMFRIRQDVRFLVFFFYLELWAMRKTRFLLIQSLSLWHDPIFCWTFGIFFCFVYNNATITEKLNCICTLNRTFAELYWCVRVWVCCLHTKMHSKSPKSFTVFFLQIRFFPGFIRIRGDHIRTQLTCVTNFRA